MDIMKKYKQGEMGMEYGMPSKEKPQANILKKYTTGEWNAQLENKIYGK